MQDNVKTKTQLLEELERLRERIQFLEQQALDRHDRHLVERSIAPPAEEEDDESGRPIRQSGAVREIAELKQAERALAQREDRLIKAQLMAGMGDFTWDTETGEVTWSDALFDLLKYDKSDQIDYSKVNEKIHHPDDLERITRWLEDCLASGSDILTPNEYRIIQKTGEVIYVRTVGVIEHREGKAQKIFASIQNITKRKEAELALQKSQELYRGVVEVTPLLICSFLETGEITFVNKAYCEYFGLASEELIGSNFLVLIPEAERNDVMTNLRALTVDSPTQSHVHQAFAPSGEKRWQRWTNRALFDAEGRLTGYQAIGEDITDRKREQETRNELLALLKTAEELGQSGSWSQDLMTGREEWSQGEYRIHGIAMDVEPSFEKHLQCVHPDDRDRHERFFREHLASSDQSSFSQEYRIIRADGNLRYIEANYEILRDENGRPVKAYGTDKDITERKRGEEERRALGDKLRLAMSAAGEGLWEWNLKTDRMRLDDVALQMLGYSRDDIKERMFDGSWWIKQLHIDDQEKTDRKFERYLAGKIKSFSVEFRIKVKDGRYIWVASTGGILSRGKEGQPDIVIGIHRDITERKHAEEERTMLHKQLVQAQKMEALGTLAGGIAHDFNNLLFAILGNTEMAIDMIDDKSFIMDRLKEAQKAGERARDLVKQILSFSRQSVTEREPVRCELVVEEALALLRATIPSSIEIKKDLRCECDKVYSTSTEIHQIIMNLCTNAVQSMEENIGEIEVVLKNEEISSERSMGYDDPDPGSYVVLTVRDVGCGIHHTLLGRIFDPFYTSKATGEGTGLGLSVVHGIVKELGGVINVESEVNKGSVFSVYLPCLTSSEAFGQHDEKTIPSGSGTILVVDDESAIVDLHGTMLTSLGYDVVKSTVSHEALALFQEDPHQFDLVITDQTMPKLTGDKLVEELHKIRSDLPVILCTGFSAQITDQRITKLGVNKVLMKPISRRKLAETISNIMKDKK